MIEIRKEALTLDLKKRIYEGLRRHAIEKIGFDEIFDEVAFVAINEEKIIGAVVVESFWGALHIKDLYVEDQYRDKKIASNLMQMVFKYASDNKCLFAFVETFSFQAVGFYQKLGFKLEFTRSGYNHGISLHYLCKGL